MKRKRLHKITLKQRCKNFGRMVEWKFWFENNKCTTFGVPEVRLDKKGNPITPNL